MSEYEATKYFCQIETEAGREREPGNADLHSAKRMSPDIPWTALQRIFKLRAVASGFRWMSGFETSVLVTREFHFT